MTKSPRQLSEQAAKARENLNRARDGDLRAMLKFLAEKYEERAFELETDGAGKANIEKKRPQFVLNRAPSYRSVPEANPTRMINARQ